MKNDHLLSMDEMDSMGRRMHAFADDVLGHHDAVGVANLLRRGEVSTQEVMAAAIRRTESVEQLHALAARCFTAPRITPDTETWAPFRGVPAFIKDNVELQGVPTLHGSHAVPVRPAKRDDEVVQHLLAQGLVVLGKTRLPEFGFSPTTEFQHDEATHNPWNLLYSSGGSSGGAAALVAAGAVPIAHGNDGGGSIRIPAAVNGLVGLKSSRGRVPSHVAAARLPVKIIVDGVLTRTVRDSAHFIAAIEKSYQTKLPKIGLVEGPSAKRLRIGLVFDSVGGVTSCQETRQAVAKIAQVLEKLGHEIIPIEPPVPQFFVDDFKLYWGFVAYSLRRNGKRFFGQEFDANKLDGLTHGLADYFKKRTWRLPLALVRLRGSSLAYGWAFRHLDAVLSPVLAHTTPPLGQLNPSVPFDELFERIAHFSAFTPLNNATGSPAIAVPAGLSSLGLPIGVHFSAAFGAEGTLLDIAYQLEAEVGFPKIDQRE